MVLVGGSGAMTSLSLYDDDLKSLEGPGKEANVATQ